MKYNNDNYIKNNTEIRQTHEDGHSKNDHHKCGYSYFKRLVSYIMAFILTVIATCTTLAVNPSMTIHVHAEEKKGYHKGTFSKTYTIVRLDDDPYFSSVTELYRENSKSRFSWGDTVWCGTCNDLYGEHGHGFTQAACYYGYYDDTVYGAWTITGVHMYGGGENRISSACALHNKAGNEPCNETHGKSASSADLNCETDAVKKFTNAWEFDYFNNHVKVNGSAVPSLSLQRLVDDKGCSYSFSAEKGLGGTITVNYPDMWVPNEYTISFNPNNGENTSTKTVTYDTGNWNAGAVSASRTGYTLQGWYTGTDGTGEMVYDASGNAVNGTYWSGTGASAIWKGLSNVPLYAYWKADNFTVTLYFYKDGVKDDSKTKTYSVQNGATFNATEHVGDSSFDNCHYVSVDTASWKVTADSSTNVYYERNVLKVAYRGNGNDGGSTDGTPVKYGDTVTIAQNGFTRTGCSFTGWNTAADGSGTSYSAGSTFTAQPSGSEDRLTLFAQWSPHVHTVTLNRGTGISAVSGSGSHYYGEDVTITSTTAAGYESPYWRQDIEGSGTAFGNSYTFKMPDDSISFTAYATAKTYTATFNSNGGTLTVDGVATNETARTVKYDAVDYWDISWISASRPGYRLGGWITGTGEKVWDESGHAVKGDYWSDNGSAALWKYDGDVTVYADWIDATPPTVNVSPSQTTDYAKSISIAITVDDMAGNDVGQLAENNAYQYCVCTDADSPSGNWTDYTSTSPFYIGGGLTGTYYVWVKPVKDAAGNESISSHNTGYHRFGPYYFDNTAPDLSNVSGSYGWFGEGTVIAFDVSDPHSGTDSMIIADFNGIVPADGDITADRQFYFGSEGVALYTITASDRLGNTAQKSFIVKIDRKGDIISDNAVWKGLGDLTVFAHWAPNTYTVQFERNDNDGGSTRAEGSMPDVSFTYDRDEKLPDNGYTREGYAFIEWNTSPDGTGSSYAGGETVRNLTIMPGGVIKLYAIWKNNSYTLTFDYNKPPEASHTVVKSDEKRRKVYYDSVIGGLPEPGLTGYIFEGWYIDGVKIYGKDIWKYKTDKAAVAKWSACGYEVRLHGFTDYDAGILTMEKKAPYGWTWNNAGGYCSAVFIYDSESSIPAPDDTYALLSMTTGLQIEYSSSGWYGNEICSAYVGSGTKKWNLSAVDGDIVDLYPAWRDNVGPDIEVTPTCTVNPDVTGNAVKSIDVTISVSEYGSGLADSNRYEYGFSADISSLPSEWQEYSATTGTESFTVTLPELGSDLDGYYYLWVRQVKDRHGNSSTSVSAIKTVNACHVYGVYAFDNTAPTGTVKYVENNEMLGLYNDDITGSPYAVMTISDPYDNLSGIESFSLRISDAADASNSTDILFTLVGGIYTCRFNLYDSLADSGNVEQVCMKVIARDKLGNTATLPVTQYDFGTTQNGTTIKAEDIGYKDESGGGVGEHVYVRDNFRVEAYIQAVTGGTQFKAGRWGILRIYTFGYVDAVEADFGSLMKFYDPAYDKDPTLIRTPIVPEISFLYKHEFAVPLYCIESSFYDTRAIGYKGGRSQHRYVAYSVSESILDDIRTILKYKIY